MATRMHDWSQSVGEVGGKRPKYGKDHPSDSHPGWWKGLGGGNTQCHVPESFMKEGDLPEGVVDDLHDGVEPLQTNHCSSWV